MTRTEIKQNIHSLVDSVEDYKKLKEIREIVEYLVNEDVVEWNSLSHQEQLAIQEGIQDAENGNTIDYDDFKRKHAKWFEK
jgi:hypothetical protein